MRKAFTLIELLVVIAIVGILSATILVAINQARKNAKDARVKADLAQVRRLITNYYLNTNSYYGLSKCINDQCVPGGSWPATDDTDGTISQIRTLAKDIETNINKTSGATHYGLYLRSNSKGAVFLSKLPSSITTDASTTKWICFDMAGNSKTYGIFGSSPTESAQANYAWVSCIGSGSCSCR